MNNVYAFIQNPKPFLEVCGSSTAYKIMERLTKIKIWNFDFKNNFYIFATENKTIFTFNLKMFEHEKVA